MNNKAKKMIIGLLISVIFFNTVSINTYASNNRLEYRDLDENEVEIESQNLFTGEIDSYILSCEKEDRGFNNDVKNNKTINRQINSRIELKTVFGPDDRTLVTNTTRAPYKYIGQIVSKYRNNINGKMESRVSTGFLVGKSIILTAAHCVYKEDMTLISAKFYPAQNGNNNRPYEYICTNTHVPAEYKKAVANNDETNKSKYDYAVVQLSKPAGQDLGFFELGGYNTAYNINNLVNKQCTVVGYPGEKQGKMYRHKGVIKGFYSNGYTMYYNIDTTSGQSGSPVIYPAPNGHYYVVAINRAHSDYYNLGRYITKNIYELVMKWR